MLKYLKTYYPLSKNIFLKPLSNLEYVGFCYQYRIKDSLIKTLQSNFLRSRWTQNTLGDGKDIKNLCNHDVSTDKLFSAYLKPFFAAFSFSKAKLSNNFLQFKGAHFQRLYSTSNEPSSDENEKHLMDFPQIVWPNFLQSLKNAVFVTLIVKPYYEPEFSFYQFGIITKKVLEIVSEILSQGDFNSLKDFIEEKALEEIKKNFSTFSFKERLELASKYDDVFFSFPYQVGLIYKKEEGESSERVFMEVTMCYHLFRGLKDFTEKAERMNDGGVKSLYDNQDRISIANCRFIKEITKGSNDQWTINILNHFKPVKLAPRF